MWPSDKLLDRWLGNCFRSFLKTLRPANPNDDYYGDRCAFCWDYYHDDHCGMRLPCAHIFGFDCLCEIVKQANGQTCPICRAVWFRNPSLMVEARRCVLTFCTWLFYFVLPMVMKLHTSWLWLQSHSPRTQSALFIVYILCNGNFHTLAQYLIDKNTSLRDRNPDLGFSG
jgi:hypothetical protein